VSFQRRVPHTVQEDCTDDIKCKANTSHDENQFGFSTPGGSQ
jgi:hypothetical protein